MKSLCQLSFIGLAAVLVLASCNMEKRVYMSGYYIQWNKPKNSDKQEPVNNENENKTKQGEIVKGEQTNNETDDHRRMKKSHNEI